MELLIGKSYRHMLENNTYLDISVCPKKWTTNVNMSLWENGKGIAIAVSDKAYPNFNKFLTIKWAQKLTIYFLNKQSQKVAGINLVNESDFAEKP